MSIRKDPKYKKQAKLSLWSDLFGLEEFPWQKLRNPPNWVCNYGGRTPGIMYVSGRTFEYKIATPLIEGAEQGHHRGNSIYYRRPLLSKRHKFK